MMKEPNWQALAKLSGNSLKAEVFSLLQRASIEIQEGESDDPTVLALVPRLAELIASKQELNGFGEVFCALARSVGLWNYIDKKVADPRDRFIAEAVTVNELGGITFHREQIAALNILLAGKNLILSAPTSFGKSLLVDALLHSGKYKRIAIVLPTIALLDEFRRRLVSRFGNKFDVLMHHSETPQRDRVVFLGTQERLINREDLGTLDLVVVDEFYKLDPARKDERSVTLNAAVYQLLRKSRQFFFLGPNIEFVRISSDSRWRFDFLKTRFSTVAVDTFDLKGVANKYERLKDEAYEAHNWPALLFVSSPDKANELASSLVAECPTVGDGKELSDWIKTNFGGRWEVKDAVASGIGVHHGRVPRALASRLVKMFNDGKLPILICTSTLIEGVNTAAKSVLIYDKTINRERYDFFTFSNIRGRAGRLGQHHVGSVYLFHAPPDHQDVEVTAPLFGDLDDAPDELVVHIGDEDATPAISDRIEEISDRLGITAAELRRFSTLGIDRLAEIKDEVNAALSKNPGRLAWSGWPEYDDIGAICEIICKVKRANSFGCASFKQLTLYIHQLRRATSLKNFFSWHSSSYKGDALKLDNVFKFLRACEYSLPEYFGAVEMFVTQEGWSADYALFLAELPRWFRAEALKNLEEQGVPIQISERFLRQGDTVSTLGNRLRQFAEQGDQRLSGLERQWILDALPRLRS